MNNQYKLKNKILPEDLNKILRNLKKLQNRKKKSLLLGLITVIGILKAQGKYLKKLLPFYSK